MSENRKRNQTLTIRVTAGEQDAITQKAARARMSVTDYIVAFSQLTQIHVAEDTRPLVTELKRIGNNLNQISMKISRNKEEFIREMKRAHSSPQKIRIVYKDIGIVDSEMEKGEQLVRMVALPEENIDVQLLA